MSLRAPSDVFITKTGRVVRISGPYSEQQRDLPGPEKFYGWTSLDGRGLATDEAAEVDQAIRIRALAPVPSERER